MSKDMSSDKVVAWLCDAGDGQNIDAVATEHGRDTYARMRRTITPLVPLSALEQCRAELAETEELLADEGRDMARLEQQYAQCRAELGALRAVASDLAFCLSDAYGYTTAAKTLLPERIKRVIADYAALTKEKK